MESGIINSYENSGNNLVGTRNFISLEAQLQTFLSFPVKVSVIGFVHRDKESNSTIQFEKLTEAASKFGIKVLEIKPKTVQDLLGELQDNHGSFDALYSACDTLIQSGGEEIVIEYARQNKIPDFTCNKSGVQKGSFVGSVADFSIIGSLSGKKAISILKDGKAPKLLKTEWPSTGSLVLNLTTAKMLGIKISTDKLTTAKEVFR